MIASHREWLELVVEEAVWPDLEICDAHHHLWDGSSSLYPGDVYLAEDLAADASVGHNIRSTVFVECLSNYLTTGPLELRPTGETAFVADVADQLVGIGGPSLGAIVSYVDINLGEMVRPLLKRHMEVGGGLFRGVRFATASDPHPDVRGNHIKAPHDALLSDKFTEALQVLAELGLTFDTWMYHHQLPQLTTVAARVPEAVIIVDHLGGPIGMGPYRNDPNVRPIWRENLAAVAELPNIRLKLGGIGMPSMGADWKGGDRPPTSTELAERWFEDVNFAVGVFGAERCMFESNFPVDRQNASYMVLWNAFKRIATDWTEDQRKLTFHDTAVAVYNIS